jgi:hypothetical protein
MIQIPEDADFVEFKAQDCVYKGCATAPSVPHQFERLDVRDILRRDVKCDGPGFIELEVSDSKNI